MKGTIKIVTLVAIQMIGLVVYGQQDAHYTQYMFNKLPINAGYTGAREVLSLRALYRDQWVGIDGHPRTITLSGHAPLKNENLAAGGYLVYDELGLERKAMLDGTYAYRVPIGEKMKLGIGINAGIMWYQHKLSESRPNDPTDPSLNVDISKILPDVGAGLYFYHPNFYLGWSIPNFVTMDLQNKGQQTNSDIFAKRVMHMYSQAGVIIPIGKILKLRPQVMVSNILNLKYKYPITFDANFSIMMYDRVNIGASYRTSMGKRDNPDRLENGDSFDVMAEFWPTRQMMIGYAYDFSLTDLQQYNNGSHEVILGYDFKYKKERIVTPRYF
jgi:type IX secretion system PorP/SprF family membrane protein